MTIDIDEAKVARNEAGLWLGWVLATAVGMLLGYLPFVFFVEDLDLGLVRILIPLWSGFMVGVLQWLVLSRFLTHSADWIINGGAGYALGYALGLSVIQILGESPLGALVGYILFGVIVALLQWPVLRREIPNVVPWLLANVAGWALGAYLGPWILNLIVSGSTASQVLSTAVISASTGLIAGAITGLALVWIVRQPEMEPFEPPEMERMK